MTHISDLMLKTDARSLLDYIEDCATKRDAHLSVSKEIMDAYTSSTRQTPVLDPNDPLNDGKWPENHTFEWLSLVLPKVIYSNPRVRVSGRFSGVDEDIASRMTAGINHTLRMQKGHRHLKDLFVNMSAGFAVGQVRIAAMPTSGMSTRERAALAFKPMMPMIDRIPPHRFIYDSDADDFERMRFMGHMWRADKEDLLDSDEYDREQVQKMVIGEGKERYHQKRKMRDGKKEEIEEVFGYDIWVPEAEIPDKEKRESGKYHGMIFTVAVSATSEGQSEPVHLRKPVPYYGPASGPYHLFDSYPVPDMPLPLAPLAATWDQVKELNNHAKSASKSAINWKKIVVVGDNNQKTAQVITDTTHGHVVNVDGTLDNVKEMEFGGLSDMQLDMVAFMRERRDRSTGLSDQSRGPLSAGSASASATLIADNANMRDARLSFLEQQFHEGVIALLEKMAWFLYNNEFVAFRMDREAAVQLHPRPKTLPDEGAAEEIVMKEFEKNGLIETFDTQSFLSRVDEVRKVLRWNPASAFPTDDILDVADKGDGTYVGKSLFELSGGIPFEYFDFDIEPYSMSRTDQAMLQKRAQDRVTITSKIAMVMAQTPWVKWGDLMTMWGESNNDSSFRDIIDMEMLKKVQEIMNQGLFQKMQGAMGGGVQSPATSNQMGDGTFSDVGEFNPVADLTNMQNEGLPMQQEGLE